MYSINLKTLLTAIFLTLFSQTAWAEDAKPIPLEPTVLERSVIQQKLKNILQDALKAAPSRVEKLKQLAEQDKLVVEQNKLLVPKVRMAIGNRLCHSGILLPATCLANYV